MTVRYFNGDRAGDRRVMVRGVAKPPALRRRTLRALCLLCLAVIGWGRWAAGRRIGPWWCRWSGGGGCAARPERRQRHRYQLRRLRAGGRGVPAARAAARASGLAGLVLGLGCRSAQLRHRGAATGDAGARVQPDGRVCDGLAALTGCLCAVPVQRVLRRVHGFVFVQVRTRRRRWAILAGAAVIVTAVCAGGLEKGVGSLLCAAPCGPSRQKTPTPFPGGTAVDWVRCAPSSVRRCR